jgi:hypothetical protein
MSKRRSAADEPQIKKRRLKKAATKPRKKSKGARKGAVRKSRQAVAKSRTLRKAPRRKPTPKKRWKLFSWLEVDILLLILDFRQDDRYQDGMTAEEIRNELLERRKNSAGISKPNVQANITKLRKRGFLEDRERHADPGKRGEHPSAYSVVPTEINTWNTTAELLMRLKGYLEGGAPPNVIMSEVLALDMPDPDKEYREPLSQVSVRHQMTFCKRLGYIEGVPGSPKRIRTTTRVFAEQSYLVRLRSTPRHPKSAS